MLVANLSLDRNNLVELFIGLKYINIRSMGYIQEKAALSLRVVHNVLKRRGALTVNICPYGVFTASDQGLDLIARSDGNLVDKPRSGSLYYPNQFAGSDRSAFCPMDAPVWGMRKVVRDVFGDGRTRDYREAVDVASKDAVELLVGQSGLTANTNDLSRSLMLSISEQVMFGIKLSKDSLDEITTAYADFNQWCAITTVTKGFSDLGRYPKLSYKGLIEREAPEPQEKNALAKASSLIFGKSQERFNRSLTVIASHTEDVWMHLEEKDDPLFLKYKQMSGELGIDRTGIIVELTNILGGAISSPASFLGFSLAAYGRLDRGEQFRVRSDSVYRNAFYHEVQRLYQPLAWFIRNITNPVDVNGKEYKSGGFVFFSYTYNRRPDIWGVDSTAFRPERFIETPSLSQKLIFFGKGRRRCPAGKFGEAMAISAFENITDTYDVKAEGNLKVVLKDSLSPGGEISLKPHQS